MRDFRSHDPRGLHQNIQQEYSHIAHPNEFQHALTKFLLTTASVAWRTNTEEKTAYAEIAKATAAPKFWRTAERFTAKKRI